MLLPSNEEEMLQFLIEKSKTNPEWRNTLERFADEKGISYDQKDAEIHLKSYADWDGVTYPSEEEAEAEREQWELLDKTGI